MSKSAIVLIWIIKSGKPILRIIKSSSLVYTKESPCLPISTMAEITPNFIVKEHIEASLAIPYKTNSDKQIIFQHLSCVHYATKQYVKYGQRNYINSHHTHATHSNTPLILSTNCLGVNSRLIFHFRMSYALLQLASAVLESRAPPSYWTDIRKYWRQMLRNCIRVAEVYNISNTQKSIFKDCSDYV
jgi:hypothetical protein